MLTANKQQIIKETNDYSLIEIIKQLNDIENEEDLINWLDFAGTHNYYTGHVWNTIYNENKELETIIKDLIDNEEYLIYLTYKADENDIFLFKSSEELIKFEKKGEHNEKIKHALEHNKILTLEEFDNIYYYNKNDTESYIDELYSIPEHLQMFIDYEHILNELEHEQNYFKINENELIIDENMEI